MMILISASSDTHAAELSPACVLTSGLTSSEFSSLRPEANRLLQICLSVKVSGINTMNRNVEATAARSGVPDAKESPCVLL
jgi:hypothetical protein